MCPGEGGQDNRDLGDTEGSQKLSREQVEGKYKHQILTTSNASVLPTQICPPVRLFKLLF